MKQKTHFAVGFLISFAAIAAALVITNTLQFANAAFLPIPEELCGFFPCPEGDTGVDIAKSLAGRIVDNVRFIIGAVAIFMIVVSGVKLVANSGNEEVFTKQSTALIYAVVGLFVVGLAGELSAIFDVSRGGFLNDPNTALQRSRLFNRTVEIVITFIKYIIASVSVLYVVRSGLRLVLLGGNEEEIGKDKKSVLYGFLGLIIIMMANPIVNKVFFKIDASKFPGGEPVRPGIDVKQLTLEIAGVTNIIAAIAGPFALLSLVVGGLMYALAGGDEEKTGKAKKILLWSALALVIIYGAFAIVSTFVTRQFEGI